MNRIESRDTESRQQLGEWQGWTPPYTELQVFFLLRLERSLKLRRQHPLLRTSDFWWSKLLSKAIYSTYCDCIDQGAGVEAKSLFAHDRASAN